MPEKLEDQEVQRKMLQFQILQSNLQAVKQRQEIVAHSLEELQQTKTTIEQLKDIKSTEALIPLGSNNFASGTIKDLKNIFVGIGGGVVIKKTRQDASEIISDRIEEVKNILDELAEQENKLTYELQKLQPDIEKILKKE